MSVEHLMEYQPPWSTRPISLWALDLIIVGLLISCIPVMMGCADDGENEWSSGMPSQRTSPVTDLVATPDDMVIDLTWSSVYEADGSSFHSYQVYKDDNNPITSVATMTPIAVISTNTTTWCHVDSLVNMHTYYFAVTAVNSSMSESAILTTSGVPREFVPPEISDITITGLTHMSATITWSTDEPATTYLKYGTTQSYGMLIYDDSLIWAHTVNLSSLDPFTVYHFAVNSTDYCCNTNESGGHQFNTTGEPDTDAPIIYNEMTDTPGEDEITMYWSTDEPATSLVKYGETTDYGGMVYNSTYKYQHSMVLSSLTPSTKYHYVINSTDAQGNCAQTADQTFTTADMGSHVADIRGYVYDGYAGMEEGVYDVRVYLIKEVQFDEEDFEIYPYPTGPGSRAPYNHDDYHYTDYDGSYEFEGIKEGDYVIGVCDSYYTPSWSGISITDDGTYWVNLSVEYKYQDSDEDGYYDYVEEFFGSDPKGRYDAPYAGVSTGAFEITLRDSIEVKIEYFRTFVGVDAYPLRKDMDEEGDDNGVVSNSEATAYEEFGKEEIDFEDPPFISIIKVDNRFPVEGHETTEIAGAEGALYSSTPLTVHWRYEYSFEVDVEKTLHKVGFGYYYSSSYRRGEDNIGPARCTVDPQQDVHGSRGGTRASYAEPFFDGWEETELPTSLSIVIPEGMFIEESTIKPSGLQENLNEQRTGIFLEGDDTKVLNGHNDPITFTMGPPKNHPPHIVISSPVNYTNYNEKDGILFDASGTTDPEGDSISFLWVSDMVGSFGRSPKFTTNLMAGTHLVTLWADDGMGNNISVYRTFSVLPASLAADTDGDGIPDSQDTDDDNDGINDTTELKMGTDPFDVTSHPPLSDLDSDGLMDFEDDDIDGDGIPNDKDLDPYRKIDSDPVDVASDDDDGGGTHYKWIAISVLLVIIVGCMLLFWMRRVKGARGDAVSNGKTYGKPLPYQQMKSTGIRGPLPRDPTGSDMRVSGPGGGKIPTPLPAQYRMGPRSRPQPSLEDENIEWELDDRSDDRNDAISNNRSENSKTF